MRASNWLGVIVVTVMGALALPGSGQSAAPTPPPSCPCKAKKPPLGQRFHQGLKKVPGRLDLAVAYDYEWAKTSALQDQSLSLQGGLADVAYRISAKSDRFAIVARVEGKQASDVPPGLSLSEIRALAGPRFTYGIPAKRALPRIEFYALGLFGYVHGLNGAFPQSGSPTLLRVSADSFAWEAGAGVSLPIRHGFGIRLAEVDYVQTYLPNNANNQQDDIQLSAGITYHFWRK